MNDNRRFPHLFWPIIFIGVGAYYLMANLGMIEAIDFSEIWRLWPVFLVIAGINMLFGRSNRWLASLFSGLLALLVVAFLFFAPMLMDSLPTPERQSEYFSDVMIDVRAADVSIDFDRGSLQIDGSAESGLLFESTVTHDEKVTFNASGTSTRNIRLRLDQVGAPPFGDWLDQSQIRAEIALSPDVPVSLDVNIGGGSAEMDLADLMLEDLKADSGSGGLTAFLPGGDYKVDLSSGSGGLTVETAPNSELDMSLDVGSGRIMVTLAEGNTGEVRLDSGSGSITVVVPEGVAVQLSGDTGSGSVNVPDGFERVSGTERFSGDGGRWQTIGFDEADQQLIIRFDVGSGSIRVEYP